MTSAAIPSRLRAGDSTVRQRAVSDPLTAPLQEATSHAPEHQSKESKAMKAMTAFHPRPSLLSPALAYQTFHPFRNFLNFQLLTLTLLTIHTFYPQLSPFTNVPPPSDYSLSSLFSALLAPMTRVESSVLLNDLFRGWGTLVKGEAGMLASWFAICWGYGEGWRRGWTWGPWRIDPKGRTQVTPEQHCVQFGFLAGMIWWIWAREWYWVPSGYLVMTTLVQTMKMHSYITTNTHYAQTHAKLLQEKTLLAQIDSRTRSSRSSASPSFFSPVPQTSTPTPEVRSSLSAPSGDAPDVTALTTAIQEEALEAQIVSLTSELAAHPFPGGEHSEAVVWPKTLNFTNLREWCIIPTLIYSLNYPRSASRSFGYIGLKTLETAATFFFLCFVIEQYCLPYLPQLGQNIPKDILYLSAPFITCFNLLFLIMFECICNGLAEITYFADREFYEEWWASVTWDQYARRWNKPVHTFLLHHVYTPLLDPPSSPPTKRKFSRLRATFLTFLLSALCHELVMLVVTRKWRFYLFLLQMLQLPMIAIGKHPIIRAHKTFGNLSFWFGLVVGPPILCVGYLRF